MAAGCYMQQWLKRPSKHVNRTINFYPAVFLSVSVHDESVNISHDLWRLQICGLSA